MKKLWIILPILILVMGCEEEAEESTIEDIFVGTWSVTNLGKYANANCSGDIDYTEWGIVQAFGITINLNFKNDGTLDFTTTAFGMTETETLTWTATEDELCIDDECINYTLSEDEKTLSIVFTEDAYCEDGNGDEVAMTETECGTAGNDWYDAACYMYTMTK